MSKKKSSGLGSAFAETRRFVSDSSATSFEAKKGGYYDTPYE